MVIQFHFLVFLSTMLPFELQLIQFGKGNNAI